MKILFKAIVLGAIVGGFLSSSVHADLSNSLVRYYKLDEPAGAVAAADEVDLSGINNLVENSSSRKSLPSSGAVGQIGGAWDFEKNPGTTTGDYDGSGGAVRGRDFLVWQQNAGTTNILPGDSSPGTVDGTDLVNWQNNYGLELNDLALLDDEGFPLAQFLDEGNSVWGGANVNGVFFSIWVKPESLNTGTGVESRNVIISEDDASQDFYVRSIEGGRIEMAMEGVGEVFTSNVVLAEGQWTHIAGGLIVHDGFEFTNTLIVYINGVATAINEFATTNTPDAFNDLILGTQDDIADDVSSDDPLAGYFARTSWDGLMDDAAFWTRTLSAAEVLDIYSRGMLGLGLLDGQATLGTQTIPEPGAFCLLSIGAASVLIGRRGQLKRSPV